VIKHTVLFNKHSALLSKHKKHGCDGFNG
jgi:hypothetical protein